MSSDIDYTIKNVDEIPSPALVVYKDIVARNIQTIGGLLDGYDRLRPHIKTHKMSAVAKMEMDAGITKFKCATSKEAALLAANGATDVMIAYPPIGPQIRRVVDLAQIHSNVTFRVIGDDEPSIRSLSEACVDANVSIGVLIDVNTGMNRTGAPPGEPSVELAKLIDSLDGLTFDGLHAYDGHVKGDGEPRQTKAKESVQLAVDTRKQIEAAGIDCPYVVASGSKGFDATDEVDGVTEVSPGTWIFWDTGYGEALAFPFNWAALVVSRVISTPADDLITLDAGNKGINPDVPAPHFRALNLAGELEFLVRNEEHQLIRLEPGVKCPNVGDVIYLIPKHVCTTVNLYDEAYVIDSDGNWTETWSIDARGH
ncbi:TPA: threonine aldolase [Candidatus Latescibacteria bacterium]|nr:threonine aldolase [Candidatus Latescibacterota bacterium]